jgi:hypothetical protein
MPEGYTSQPSSPVVIATQTRRRSADSCRSRWRSATAATPESVVGRLCVSASDRPGIASCRRATPPNARRLLVIATQTDAGRPTVAARVGGRSTASALHDGRPTSGDLRMKRWRSHMGSPASQGGYSSSELSPEFPSEASHSAGSSGRPSSAEAAPSPSPRIPRLATVVAPGSEGRSI